MRSVDSNFNAILWTWESALLLGPVLGFLLRPLLRQAHHRVKFGVYAILSAVLATALLISFSPVSFRGVKAGAMVGAAGYGAFCIFAFVVLSWRRYGKPAFFAMAVPMGLGIVLATIGGLGLAFIVGDIVPLRETSVDSQYSCRFNSFGNATTSNGGITVTVLYHPRIAPLVEWKRYSRSFDDQEYKSKEVACSLDSAVGRKMIITAPALNGPPERIAIPLN